MDVTQLCFAGVVFFLYMSLLWWVGIQKGNAGLVDFGWPSGFTALAIFNYWVAPERHPTLLVLTVLYGTCGVRFMAGWIVRNVRDGEDRRWEYWRILWREGRGRLGIRSVASNLFFFYHAQTFATLAILIFPLVIVGQSAEVTLHPLAWVGLGLWIVGFVMENVADVQLDQHRRHGNGYQVCRRGLWRYSRHPNYFFEFVIWCAYAIFAWPYATEPLQFVVLLSVPLTAYGFLVYFAGVPVTEAASLDRRGEDYAQYQAVTNRFFPGFPKK
jgi:steroid 5-alpha reductase family enzyme